jgi:hypothetical protein
MCKATGPCDCPICVADRAKTDALAKEAGAVVLRETLSAVCPVCDTRNALDNPICEECGHNPQVARGEDDCYACRVLGYAKRPARQ